MSKSSERPILEAALKSSEVITDAMISSEVISSIPVIGTALKVCKAADAIRDKLFTAKLLSFLRALDNVSETEKRKIRDKMVTSQDEAQKVGEVLILTIEHITDLNKPLLLAQLFIAYIDNVLNANELRRLCHCIDLAFNDDLTCILSVSSLPNESQEEWLALLEPSGLVRDVSAKYWSDDGTRTFSPTLLADKLRLAHQHAISSGVK